MIISDVIKLFNRHAPLSLQESYDNSGLQIGEPESEVTGILITLDVTEQVLDEAIKTGSNLIISHHPLIFSGIKCLSGRNATERMVIRAIKEGIHIISFHTNIDNYVDGVNRKICEKLELVDTSVLAPVEGKLLKLSVFVPETHAEKVRNSIFTAGAGVIGNYDSCSFYVQGTGTFRGNEKTNPFSGKSGQLHYEREIKIETIVPSYLKEQVITALIEVHPYEEVAYDLYPLVNTNWKYGAGMTGFLPKPMNENELLSRIKKVFQSGCIRHSRLSGKQISKVAVCGGSGSLLLKNAINAGAQIFISADFKYHQFFEAEDRILVADIGHFESEQFTKEIFYELLIKKFPNFALRLSEVNTNPIHYL